MGKKSSYLCTFTTQLFLSSLLKIYFNKVAVVTYQEGNYFLDYSAKGLGIKSEDK